MGTRQAHSDNIQQTFLKILFTHGKSHNAPWYDSYQTALLNMFHHIPWEKPCGVVQCPCDCDLCQKPQLAHCHDVSGSAVLLSNTGFSKEALYPRVNRPQR